MTASHPTTKMPASAWARYYVEDCRFGLVRIPPGSKAPIHTGWNELGGYYDNPDEAERYYRQHPRDNMGVVHSASGTASFDDDHPEWTQIALEAVGINSEAILRHGCQ